MESREGVPYYWAARAAKFGVRKGGLRMFFFFKGGIYSACKSRAASSIERGRARMRGRLLYYFLVEKKSGAPLESLEIMHVGKAQLEQETFFMHAAAVLPSPPMRGLQKRGPRMPSQRLGYMGWLALNNLEGRRACMGACNGCASDENGMSPPKHSLISLVLLQ